MKRSRTKPRRNRTKSAGPTRSVRSGVAIATVCLTATTAWAQSKLPEGFVRLRDVAPGIIVEMRYATPDNFTGARVPGYHANTCILATPVAQALKRVQRDVRKQSLSLKVYDCYRPARAVRSFVRWAARAGDDPATKNYYPRISKGDVIPKGYVARRSSHSRGTTVDLTLVRLDGNGRAVPPRGMAAAGTQGPCTAPIARRTPENALDMGTAYDCFDRLSHTESRLIQGQARRNRRTLLDAMRRHGFRNYRREWWHFSMPLKAYRRHRDFPVQ